MIQTCLLFLLLDAPAPLPKSPPPPVKISPTALLGDWDCKWGSTPCIMSFRKDGVYSCNYHGVDWYGSWELNGDVLTIKEWMCGFETNHVWVIKLTSAHSGLIDYASSSLDFSLHPRGSLILGPKL